MAAVGAVGGAEGAAQICRQVIITGEQPMMSAKTTIATARKSMPSLKSEDVPETFKWKDMFVKAPVMPSLRCKDAFVKAPAMPSFRCKDASVMPSLRCKDAFVKAPVMPSFKSKAAFAPASPPMPLRRCTRTDTCAGRERVFARGGRGAGHAL